MDINVSKQKRIVTVFTILMIVFVLSFFLEQSFLLKTWTHQEKMQLKKRILNNFPDSLQQEGSLLFDSCMFDEIKKRYPRADLFHKNPLALIEIFGDKNFLEKMVNCRKKLILEVSKHLKEEQKSRLSPKDTLSNVPKKP